MNYGIKKFIKENLQLIDDGNWDEFYSKVGDNTSVGDIFQMDNYIGALTEFLMSCGCNPMEGFTRSIPAAFLSGSVLSELHITSNIWSIGCNAFAGMRNITSVHIPANVEVINLHCFEGCENLTFVKIDNPDISIHETAFDHCGKLRSIDFSGTVLDWREKDIILYDAVVTCTDGCVIYDKRGDFI
jgi:hypothetical protein